MEQKDVHIDPTAPAAAHVTPDQVKQYEALVLNIFGGIVRLVPGKTGQVLRSIDAVIEQYGREDWFVELMTVLVNAFEDRQMPTKEAILKALAAYLLKHQVG
jgi:hypothetical protein